ncbi:uncharacterized protein LOC111115363 [Crassostrea virginica]
MIGNILGLLLFFSCVTQSVGLYCVSCTDSVSPRHCHFVQKCNDGEVCYTDSHLTRNGEVVFNTGCRVRQICHAKRNSDANRKLIYRMDSRYLQNNCTECCSTNICNSQGCGQPDYPKVRGPVCFNCQQVSHPTLCDKIQVCDELQECFLQEEMEFGDIYYSSGCRSKQVCTPSQLQGVLIGKRNTGHCSKCCHTDLCNDHCNSLHSSTVMTSTSTIISSTAMTTTSTMQASSNIPTTQVSGLLCYSCSHVDHQRNCSRIVQCASHEKCYGRRFVTPDGLVYFSSGCASTAECSARRSFNLPHDDRHKMLRLDNGDVMVCGQCCDNKDYCNVQLCDNPIQLKQRCLVCDDVINPEDCNFSVQCDEDQICYTEHIYVNREKRFRMGCVHKNGCQVETVSTGGVAPAVVGRRNMMGVSYADRYRRALPREEYCAKCCTGTNCNRDLCTPRQVLTQYTLVTPPLLTACQDYEELACRNLLGVDPLFCYDQANKHLFCPRTCNTCSGGGIPLPVATTSSVTTSSVTSTSTSIPGNNCVDGKNCAHYADFFCNPSHPSGQDLCPITCKNPRCVGPTCKDAIPRCTCEYLDKYLQICQDGDPELQKFCCFYCKEVNDPAWKCNDSDKLFCTGKELDLSHQIQGLNITCETE